MNKWYEENVMNNDIVISSRISLSRNVSRYPFSLKISDEDSNKLIDEVKSGFFNQRKMDFYKFYDIDAMDKRTMEAMIGSCLLSRKVKENHRPQAAIIAKDAAECIRINGRNHLDIVSLAKGWQLDKAYESANRLDDLLNERIDYAYNQRYGYLTTSPADMGTGMRASYFMHLPFLQHTGLVRTIAEELNKFGYVLRAVYDESKDGAGSIYQIYNQRTLGISEEDMMASLDKIARQVVEQEKELRHTDIKKNYDAYEDSVYKAYGILKYARSLTVKEATDYLSNLRVGLCEGLIRFDTDENPDMYPLMLEIRPAVLDDIAGKSLGTSQRDRFRAEYIRNRLPEISD